MSFCWFLEADEVPTMRNTPAGCNGIALQLHSETPILYGRDRNGSWKKFPESIFQIIQFEQATFHDEDTEEN